MNDVDRLGPLTAIALVTAALAVGALASRALGVAAARSASGRPVLAGLGPSGLLGELRGALEPRQTTRTERPDVVLWALAPALYLGLAAAAISVVPLAPGLVVADVRTGIVLFGAAEALAIVAAFLHGWSPNSPLALVAGYRFVAVALSYELLSMFALIAAALPAQSLSIGAIVESQAGLWNVVRQPLGLPLFLIVALGVTFSGPLDVLDSNDLAGGAGVEDSGAQRAAWAIGRHAMRAAFAACAAAVFLGGWHGPVLPGGAWMALKTAAVLGVLALADVHLARWSPHRIVRAAWLVLLPLAFADLVIAGLGSL